ncbi:MAG TPA: AMP-binding protein [Acidobacteriota bacterium]|nr:AMP-binding protein [Acidobacteriota bacterium]
MSGGGEKAVFAASPLSSLFPHLGSPVPQLLRFLLDERRAAVVAFAAPMQSLDFFHQFRDNVRQRPDHPVFQLLGEEGREVFTTSQVAEGLRRVSRFLQCRGLEKGQAVGIIMENHPRWGVAYLGAQSAGAVVVPFDILHSSKTLAELIGHSECQFLITSAGLTQKLLEIQDRLPQSLPVLVAGQAEEAPPEWHRWDDLMEEELSEEIPMPLVERDPDEPLSIMYTSGTTGDPKGVVLSQAAVYRNVNAVFEQIKVTEDDHILSVLPLYHALALMANFIMPLYVNARTTYLPVLEAQRILKAFREEGITIFVCVPQFFYLVHKRIFQEVERQGLLKRKLFRILLRLSHFCNQRLGFNAGKMLFKRVRAPFGEKFNFFAVGGARFDTEVARSFRDLGFNILQAYGMTETSAVATVTDLDDPRAVGSVGQSLPHVEVRIEDPDADGIGQVLVGGGSLMQGYWKNPRATAETLRDGWLHTGDLGYLDSHGRLNITGRKKDVIVLSSGKNIFPEELEHFYQEEIPLIKEMCILGLPDETSDEGQEKLHAVVVPDFEESKRQQIVNVADMVRYLLENASQKLPAYKRVRSFTIRRDPLPRTTTRKIKRFQVEEELETSPVEEEQAQAGDSDQVGDEPSSPVEERIFQMIRAAKRAPVLRRSMNLELDVGFDSLQRVEFLSNVQEAFAIEISDDDASEIFTVEQLTDAVEKRLSGQADGGESGVRSWKEILERDLSEDEIRLMKEVMDPRPVYEFLVYLTTRLVKLLCGIFLRFRTSGQENLPREFPFIVCPNHQSYIDAPLVASAMPFRVLKHAFYLGYSDYFENAFMRWVAVACKVVPVDPDRHLRQALRLGAEGLRRGQVLIVFPEGERTIDGTLKPFRGGPAILSEVMKVPVVPVAITGAYQVWRRGSNRIRLHPVRVRIGKPLDPPAGPEQRDEFTQRLKAAVEELVEADDRPQS